MKSLLAFKHFHPIPLILQPIGNVGALISKLQKLWQKWQKIGAYCPLPLPIAVDDFSEVGTDTAGPRCHNFLSLSPNSSSPLSLSLRRVFFCERWMTFGRQERTKPIVASALLGYLKATILQLRWLASHYIFTLDMYLCLYLYLCWGYFVGKKGQSPLWHQLYLSIWKQKFLDYFDSHHTVFSCKKLYSYSYLYWMVFERWEKN